MAILLIVLLASSAETGSASAETGSASAETGYSSSSTETGYTSEALARRLRRLEESGLVVGRERRRQQPQAAHGRGRAQRTQQAAHRGVVPCGGGDLRAAHTQTHTVA